MRVEFPESEGVATLSAGVVAPNLHISRVLGFAAGVEFTAYCAVPDCTDVLGQLADMSGMVALQDDGWGARIGAIGVAFPSVVIGLLVMLGASLVRTWVASRRR